jgi:hypothetical protein
MLNPPISDVVANPQAVANSERQKIRRPFRRQGEHTGVNKAFEEGDTFHLELRNGAYARQETTHINI